MDKIKKVAMIKTIFPGIFALLLGVVLILPFLGFVLRIPAVWPWWRKNARIVIRQHGFVGTW
jgi:hypothetical protein